MLKLFMGDDHPEIDRLVLRNGNPSEFDRQEIDAAMVDLAGGNYASVANRIKALRMCGEQGNALEKLVSNAPCIGF